MPLLLLTPGPQSCDKSQHSKNAAGALEYGVRKFISAFPRSNMPPLYKKSRSGPEKPTFTGPVIIFLQKNADLQGPRCLRRKN